MSRLDKRSSQDSPLIMHAASLLTDLLEGSRKVSLLFQHTHIHAIARALTVCPFELKFETATFRESFENMAFQSIARTIRKTVRIQSCKGYAGIFP